LLEKYVSAGSNNLLSLTEQQIKPATYRRGVLAEINKYIYKEDESAHVYGKHASLRFLSNPARCHSDLNGYVCRATASEAREKREKSSEDERKRIELA
jgi:hypothetical protein